MSVLVEPKEWQAAAIAFGTRVTEERTRLGITKETLGERSGLASRYVWRVEEGRQNLQLASIMKLAGGLGLTVAALMQGLEELVAHPRPKPARMRRSKSAVERRA